MIGWLIENMVWASAAMIVVLAIRGPVAHLFGAGVAYALWLIPAARLVAPPAAWIGDLFDAPMPSLPPMVIVMDIGSGAALPSPGGPGQWVPILLAVWAGGALFFLAYQGWAYHRFLKRLGRSAEIGDHRGVALLASEAVDGPVALGLVHRRIVVPLDFASRYSPEERALALDHERHHHRRGDILANHVALLVLALNWFNPIAWIAFRAFRADQELSCDAAIAACADRQVRSDYAQALIKSASRPGLIAACPLNGADQVKRRLKMLNHHRKDRRRAWAGGAATIGLIAGSLMLGSPGIAAQDVAAAAAGVEQREADTNRALIAALQLRRADILKRAEASAGPAAAKARVGEALKFLEERIKAVQDRAAEPPAKQIIYKHEFHRDEQGGLVDRDFHADTMERVDRCRPGDDELINAEMTEAGQSTRVLVCSDSAAPDAHGPVLQRMRERVSRDSALSPEMQQRLLAEIDRAIAAERAK